MSDDIKNVTGVIRDELPALKAVAAKLMVRARASLLNATHTLGVIDDGFDSLDADAKELADLWGVASSNFPPEQLNVDALELTPADAVIRVNPAPVAAGQAFIPSIAAPPVSTLSRGTGQLPGRDAAGQPLVEPGS